MLTSADVAAVRPGAPAGLAKSVVHPDHSTNTCEWGDYTRGGLFVTIADYNDHSAFAEAKAQLLAAPDAVPVAGLGDAAIKQPDGITTVHGTTVVGVFSTGATPDPLIALAAKIVTQL